MGLDWPHNKRAKGSVRSSIAVSGTKQAREKGEPGKKVQGFGLRTHVMGKFAELEDLDEDLELK
jgi:hypothetical protein